MVMEGSAATISALRGLTFDEEYSFLDKMNYLCDRDIRFMDCSNTDPDTVRDNGLTIAGWTLVLDVILNRVDVSFDRDADSMHDTDTDDKDLPFCRESKHLWMPLCTTEAIWAAMSTVSDNWIVTMDLATADWKKLSDIKNGIKMFSDKVMARCAKDDPKVTQYRWIMYDMNGRSKITRQGGHY